MAERMCVALFALQFSRKPTKQKNNQRVKQPNSNGTLMESNVPDSTG